MEMIEWICNGITTLISVCLLYQLLYVAVGFFAKEKKFEETDILHTYGIIIAARNESKVIDNLLESIRHQNYDMTKIKVFVVADNCDDDTAQICRDHGAIVYERHDKTKARKGYALEYLFEQIHRDYGIESLEGYLFFDADNLLHPNYLMEINKAFHTGTDVAIGYRSTKNFDRNAISAASGIHFHRSTLTFHRPRARLGLPTHIAGTGYVLRSHLLKNGWHLTSLTEDTQFTLESVAKGIHIEFCEAAEFYDEQPYELSVLYKQRLRWAKGRLDCFVQCFDGLLKGIIRRDFACYDMFFYSFPTALVSAFLLLVSNGVALAAVGLVAAGNLGSLPASILPSYLPTASLLIVLYDLLTELWAIFCKAYLGFLLVGILTVIRERRHILCPTGKLILYVLAFPFLDITAVPISILALFLDVKWTPIKHDESIPIHKLLKRS